MNNNLGHLILCLVVCALSLALYRTYMNTMKKKVTQNAKLLILSPFFFSMFDLTVRFVSGSHAKLIYAEMLSLLLLILVYVNYGMKLQYRGK